MSGYVQLPIFQQIEQVCTFKNNLNCWITWHEIIVYFIYKFQKLADVWVAHNIDYRKITLSENPLSAGNFGEVFKGKDMYVQRLLY